MAPEREEVVYWCKAMKVSGVGYNRRGGDSLIELCCWFFDVFEGTS